MKKAFLISALLCCIALPSCAITPSNVSQPANTTKASNRTAPGMLYSENTTSITNTTSVSNPSYAMFIVKSVFSKQLANDGYLRVEYYDTEQANEHTIYLVHVYDPATSQYPMSTTLDWVEVRDDGLMQSRIHKNTWTTPSQYLSINGIENAP